MVHAPQMADESLAVEFIQRVFDISVYKLNVSLNNHIEFAVNDPQHLIDLASKEELEVCIESGTRIFKCRPLIAQNPNGMVVGWNFDQNRRVYINWRKDGNSSIGLMQFTGTTWSTTK